MASKKRRIGCMGWIGIALVVAALALFLTWRWAMANDSVALLDQVDGMFTSGNAELAAGPVSFGDGPEQVLYVHRPAGGGQADQVSSPLPVLVWIHGGAWRDGDPKDYGFVASNLAPEGFVVVNLGYRKSAGGKFPSMMDDGAAALRWINDNIGEYGGDPRRIYLMGHSAGAYNVAMLGLDRQWLGRAGLPDGTIDGVIGLAGPYDFLPFDTESTIRTFGDFADPAATQPVNFVRADAPPMLLLTGTADTVVKPRNSVALHKALLEAGASAELQQFDGMDHSGIVMTLARPFDRDGRTKTAIIGWLEQRDAAVLAALSAEAETESAAEPVSDPASAAVQAENR